MLGDPKECRLRALECAELAVLGASHTRQHFAKFARIWILLAKDMERTKALLAKIDAEPDL